MRTLLSLALVAGCTRPERGFDHSELIGTVRIEPETKDEKAGTNDVYDDRQRNLPPVGASVVAVSGSLSQFGVADEDGDVTGGDVDWYEVVIEAGIETTAFEVAFDGVPVGTTVAVDVYDPPASEFAEETLRSSYEGEAASDGGIHVLVEESVEPGDTLLLRIEALTGTGAAPYRLVLPGDDPNDRRYLAGAYLTEDLTTRRPVAGGEVVDWVIAEDFAWVGSYRMVFARSVVTEATDTGELTTVDEAIDAAFVFAGDWVNLAGPLAAGTWYTGSPASVTLTGEGTLSVPALTLDTEAPLVIGVETDEVEPNDVPIDSDAFTLDLTDTSAAQDLGTLTGLGFVDVLHGECPIDSDEEGYVHDVDVFTFQVPEAMVLYFTATWDEGEAVDVDVLVFDGTGEVVDGAITSSYPEADGGYFEYEPGVTYFLAVAGWLGVPGSPVPYDLLIEPAAP
jgi:hypothetical protein